MALSRAAGVLSALTACHDATRGGFAVSDQFVLQAVAAIEVFIGDARTAYMDLCDRCDLRVQEQAPQAGASDITPPDANPVLPPLPLRNDAQVADQETPPAYEEDIASNYADLLRKLTAAEVFAAERDYTQQGERSALLPLLKSLRSDLERFKAA
jgi:hypothetical protein